MSRGDTWMPLYIGDYLADTMHLNGAEHGAYLLLLMHHWRNGPLPDDDKSLAAIARTDMAAWAEIGPVVRGFWHADANGKLVQKRLMHERNKAAAISTQRAAAGREGAASRWKETEQGENGGGSGGANGSKRDGKRMANAIDLPKQTDAPSPSPSQVKKESPPTPASGGGCGQIEFETFYEKYPVAAGERAARRAWVRVIRRGADPADIMRGLDAALKAGRLDPTKRLLKEPAHWLTGGHWTDGHRPPSLATLRTQRAEMVGHLIAAGRTEADANWRADCSYPEVAASEMARA